MEKVKPRKRDNDTSELLERGVETFIDPEHTFEEKLTKEPGKLVIKLGADPTKPDLHLGHAVVLRRLRQFQDKGARVIFIVGDFTARIGDPTGKDKTRPEMSTDEIEKNLETYKKQVGKILKTDPSVFTVIRNSDWYMNVTDMGAPAGSIVKVAAESGGEKIEIPFDANSFIGKSILFEQSRMQVKDLGHKQGIAVVTIKTLFETLHHITHSRLIERDLFRERISKGSELYLHEMLYPVIQGIDSAVLAMIFGSCDLEMGGNDQTFNMLMGRDVMRANNQTPQAVMSMKILTGTDGKEKMSKSLNNYVAIDDEPKEMYGKIMSLPDSLMVEYFELATYTPTNEIEKIKTGLESGRLHPKEVKKRLAREVVEIYHGKKEAEEAEKNFEKVFSRKEIPDELETVLAETGELLGDVLKKYKIVPSVSEFRRLLKSGAIENIDNGEKIIEPAFKIESEIKLRIGKKKFVQIKI